MILADFHLHTNYSPDSSISPKLLVDRLYMHPTIKVIAVTDHNTIQGYEKVHELASVYPDILVIPGVEVTTPLGDLILLGVEENPPAAQDVNEIISFAKERAGLIVAPHPFRDYGLGNSVGHYAVDAIETLNGGTPPHINQLAQNLAKQLGLPGVAGTDAHNIDEMWTVYNEVQASMDIDEILKAIKRGLIRVFSTRKSISF